MLVMSGSFAWDLLALLTIPHGASGSLHCVEQFANDYRLLYYVYI